MSFSVFEIMYQTNKTRYHVHAVHRMQNKRVQKAYNNNNNNIDDDNNQF